jgi:glycosyltransferase involved in cell wall biosynthesis
VPEADSRALAEALISVLCDRGLSERLAAAGPSVAKRFDAAECAARVDDLYETLM